MAGLRITGRPSIRSTRWQHPVRVRHAVMHTISEHLDVIVLANTAHQCLSSPDAHRDPQTRPGRRRISRRATEHSLEPHADGQQTPLPRARVLPRLPRRRPTDPWWTVLTPRRRARSGPSLQTERAQLRAVLNRAASMGIEVEATRLGTALRRPQMRQLPLAEEAMGRQTLTCCGS